MTNDITYYLLLWKHIGASEAYWTAFACVVVIDSTKNFSVSFYSSSLHFLFATFFVFLFCGYKCSWHWPSPTYGDVQNNKVMLFPGRTEPVGRKKLHHCSLEDVIPGKAVLVCWEICFRVSKWIKTNWVLLYLQTFRPLCLPHWYSNINFLCVDGQGVCCSYQSWRLVWLHKQYSANEQSLWVQNIKTWIFTPLQRHL